MTDIAQRLHSALAGRYLPGRALGRGGMATVFLAQDLRHHREVAIKVLDPIVAATVGAQRFLREIEVAAGLHHPHIMPVFDSGEAGAPGSEGGTYLYYVMPYVAGDSLRARLEHAPQVSLEEAIGIASEVAEALDFAHRQGVIHRDIKPENILLEDGHAIVADFGVAHIITAPLEERITQSGAAIGTPAYMSPEACTGQETVDPRSDIYSLGCVVYEMLAGRAPFAGSGGRAVMARQVVDAVPPLNETRPEVPAAVVRAVARALAKDPADRFATAAEFARALATRGEWSELPASKSLAVLPFVNVSADPANEYLSDGITDEIINALTRVRDLRVASRTSTFALKGTGLDIRAIGARLAVDTVLEGSLRREGRRLRVTAQLVSAADGYQLWSERYDGEMEGVFAIQDEIAQNIVRALRVILSDHERQALHRVPATDIRAYEYYLRGRQFFHQTRKKSLQFAREMFGKAIELDPGYAPAHAGAADCCSLLHMYYPQSSPDLAEADAASRKALELAPDLPESHAARAFALWMLHQDAEAVSEFEATLRIDPKQFEALYFFARARFQKGEFEQAARLFERAAGVREDYQARFFAAQSYAALGRTTDAEAAYRRALDVSEDHLALNPDDPRAATMCAVACCRLGDRTGGLKWAERALAVDPEDAGVRYNVACLYALEGEPAKALDCLEEALRAGFGNREWIRQDPDLASLRGDPRFEALMAGASSPRNFIASSPGDRHP